MQSNLSNARLPGESFDDYRARRQAGNMAIAAYLARGTMRHESARYFTIREDAQPFDPAWRDVRRWVNDKGERMLTFRLKGVTYKRSKPAASTPVTGLPVLPT